MPGLLPLVLAALVTAGAAETSDNLRLYIGPMPNPDGLAVPVSKQFSDSYTDLAKAHQKLKPPQVVLVDDPAGADAILTITYRGDVETRSTVGMSGPIGLGPYSINGAHTVTPTLRARLTLMATRQGADFSGVNEKDDRTKWSTQAERVYTQAVEWLAAHRDQLMGLRTR